MDFHGIQPEDARYIKRRVRSGSIDVHPTDCALIVNYELEAIILGENGEPMVSEKKECQKIIRLNRLYAGTNCASLAKEVVQRCPLIHPSKTAEVEHLIYYLESRRNNAFRENVTRERQDREVGRESPYPDSCPSAEVSASFNHIEDYMALLYEDLPEKTRGSAHILELAKDPNNLADLASNEAVLSALARVLREDWKKKLELSTNIVYTFFCFSTFSQFHTIIHQYKIGSLCLEIIEYELNRYDELKKGLEIKPTAPATPPVSRLPLPRSARKRIKPVEEKKQSPNVEKCEEPKMDARRLATLAMKQNQLLRVCYYLLMNLAENVKVEDKMRRRNLVGLLVKTLDRTTKELLILVVSFLLKLSIYRENKDEMANLNLIDKLPKLLQMENKSLELVTINLLFNLSFDSSLREKMVRVGFLPKLVSMLGDEEPQVNVVVLKLLYHLSMDDRVKAMFAFTDCVHKVNGILLGSEPDDEQHILIVALMVNLALNNRCAAQILEGNNLQYLIECAFNRQSSIILKVLRNASTHDATKHLFIDFVGDLAKVVSLHNGGDNNSASEDFILECVGLMANLTLPQLDYCTLLQCYQLVSWMQTQLTGGNAPYDLILEIVMFISTVAMDESCASLLCKADILTNLIELLKAKQEDDEIVLQVVYVFYQVVRHPMTRDYLIRETQAPAYLIDLMHDKNENIRKVCDACLDIIKECDDTWADKIKTEQFEWHNSHWLAMVDNKALETSLLGDDGDSMPRYDLLEQSLLLRSAGSQSSLNTDDIEIVSNNPKSNESSRPVSSYGSNDGGHSLDNIMSPKAHVNRRTDESHEDVLNNALRNLVISEDTFGEDSHYFQID